MFKVYVVCMFILDYLVLNEFCIPLSLISYARHNTYFIQKEYNVYRISTGDLLHVTPILV